VRKDEASFQSWDGEMESILYFTELLNLPVYDLKHRRIGRVRDAALVPLVHQSRVDRFLVGTGVSWLSVRYDQISSISFDGVQLSDEKLFPYHSDEYMLRINRDLLDQQIIDVNGRKVVRVNDVTLEIQHTADFNQLFVMEVDIGLRSIVRRLVQGALPRKVVRMIQQHISPNSIRWEFCNIVEADPQRRLRLNISHDKLERMHPADLADIVEELGPAEREAIFETIDSEVAADTLSEMDSKTQASILESLEPDVAADIVEEMAPDEAADALAELEEETSMEILEEMEQEDKTEVAELLEFEEDTAGGLMNTEYASLPDAATVADAMVMLRENEELLENLNLVLLTDTEGRLTAAVPLARLFLAAGETPLKTLAQDPLISARVEMSQERVTELFDKYNIFTLPVTDQKGILSGVITADDIISLLRQK
jgi:sporulation protein YlmC with PRC-barrel domain/CBS domain-containing protein